MQYIKPYIRDWKIWWSRQHTKIWIFNIDRYNVHVDPGDFSPEASGGISPRMSLPPGIGGLRVGLVGSSPQNLLMDLLIC